MSDIRKRLDDLEARLSAFRPDCVCERPNFGGSVGIGRDARPTCGICGGKWREGWRMGIDYLDGTLHITGPDEEPWQQPRPSTDATCHCEVETPYHREGPDGRFWVCDACSGLYVPSKVIGLEEALTH